MELDVLAREPALASLVLPQLVLHGNLMNVLPMSITSAMEEVVRGNSDDAFELGVLLVVVVQEEDARVCMAGFVTEFTQSSNQVTLPCQRTVC